HAGREAALRDLVLLGTELLDRLAEKVDDRVLTGHRRWRDAAGAHPLARWLDGRDSVRVIERAEARVGIELDPFRRDPVVGLRKDDVAGCDELADVLVVPRVVRVDLGV